MEETNTVPSSVDTTTPSKTTPPLATTNSNDDSSTKRRPAQALYKPPRRSKNSDVPTPVSTPPPVATRVEDSPQGASPTKPTKSKSARPSAEPYVPPSRRSQPATEESLPSTTTTNEKPSVAEKDGSGGGEPEEDDWEKLLDGDINPLNDNSVEEIQTKFKERVQIENPTNDYSQWSVDDIQLKEADLAHVVEVSNFPSTFATEDLANIFKTLTRTAFDIKWVDDTHALIVFSDANTALDALQMEHPLYKICPMSKASTASKKKAKSSVEFLQPYKTRPQTSSLTANRRICAALGLKNSMSSDKAKSERQKIETARQQKLRDKEDQKTVWEGGVLPAS